MTRRLLRALSHSAGEHGASVMLEALSAKPWESATFSGFLHRITVTATESRAFDAWLQALPEADLPMPGHFVADIVVTDVSDGAATIEVQTIAA